MLKRHSPLWGFVFCLVFVLFVCLLLFVWFLVFYCVFYLIVVCYFILFVSIGFSIYLVSVLLLLKFKILTIILYFIF